MLAEERRCKRHPGAASMQLHGCARVVRATAGSSARASELSNLVELHMHMHMHMSYTQDRRQHRIVDLALGWGGEQVCAHHGSRYSRLQRPQVFLALFVAKGLWSCRPPRCRRSTRLGARAKTAGLLAQVAIVVGLQARATASCSRSSANRFGRVASQVFGGVKDDASGTTERRGDGSRRSSLPGGACSWQLRRWCCEGGGGRC